MNFLGHRSPKWAEWECLRIDACGPQAWQLLLINAFGEPLLLCQTDDGDMTLIAPPTRSPSLLFLLPFHSRSCRYFLVTFVRGKGGAPIREGRKPPAGVAMSRFWLSCLCLIRICLCCRFIAVLGVFQIHLSRKKNVQCELRQHRCCWIELGLNLIYKCKA